MHTLAACSSENFGYVNMHCNDWFAALSVWAAISPN